MIEDRGLGDHREVLEHYARNKSPISEYELGLIGLYGDTSYQGAHGKGRQYYAPSTNSPSLVSGPASEVSLVGGAGQVGGRAPTGIESLYRPEVSPEGGRSEEHTSELQSLMRISYAVFCLKKKKR